ncbi:hypothetical protein [Streptomyces sp. NBC_01601]|uniref:hypothetical protein n=1 Tax=Streptomyces sp. NBC_01601 TaxID=2975892 RepID=UPI002E2D3364|nr:hypothetical protein [Streptomyces sp. NBC_01601]
MCAAHLAVAGGTAPRRTAPRRAAPRRAAPRRVAVLQYVAADLHSARFDRPRPACPPARRYGRAASAPVLLGQFAPVAR